METISKLISKNSFECMISTANHVLTADEPTHLGGTDKGPNPMELLLGSLAACTVMTIKIYLNHKKIIFNDLQVKVTSRVDRIENAAILSDEERLLVDSGRIRRIHKSVIIDGDFSSEMTEKLALIAGKCPVNKLLRKTCYITDEVLFV